MVRNNYSGGDWRFSGYRRVIDMAKGYKYNIQLEDPAYVFGLINKKVKKCVGILQRENESIVYFEEELNDKELNELNKIMLSNPKPIIIYEIGIVDLEQEIYDLIGIRPIIAKHDNTLNKIVVAFDTELTKEQDAKLIKYFTELRSKVNIKTKRNGKLSDSLAMSL